MEPDVNVLKGTKYLIVGVQWSLAFEWLFYCSLAVIGSLFFRIKTSITTILLTSLGLVVFVLIIHEYYPILAWEKMSPFLGGIAAAFPTRNQRVGNFVANPWLTPALAALLYLSLLNYSTVFSPVPYLCICLIFIAIACGNDFFGILTLKASRLLGQISYSIYLLRGLLLYTTFQFIIHGATAEKLSPLSYWCVISGCCAVLILITCQTYYFIERPLLNRTDIVTKQVRDFIAKRMQPSALATKEAAVIANSVLHHTAEQEAAK
ncbi:hypothetical protein GCM10011511_54600 [Puia dinghuensis]|uniref:Acyltransferase 3 domain-containing protein n=2 Tax=Puia dinghuensis TaxID=1792502 RepID=A0A8J2UJ12_9BACT|nr:hypothetical protein GCM10011511_54600 [Puia dinghuensis]